MVYGIGICIIKCNYTVFFVLYISFLFNLGIIYLDLVVINKILEYRK